MQTQSQQLAEHLRKLNESMEESGIRYDGGQWSNLIIGLLERDAFPMRKTTPKSAEEKAASEDRRETMLAWLLANRAPDYTGSRETALSAGEILGKMSVPVNAQNLGTLRSLLSNRFKHNWAVITETDGQLLYAHVPRLLRFVPREVPPAAEAAPEADPVSATG